MEEPDSSKGIQVRAYTELSQTQCSLHFEPSNSLLWGSCPVHCEKVSSNPALYPPNASSTPSPCCDYQKCPRHYQVSLERQNPPIENCYRGREQARGSSEPAGGAHEPGKILRFQGRHRRNPFVGPFAGVPGLIATKIRRSICILVSNQCGSLQVRRAKV